MGAIEGWGSRVARRAFLSRALAAMRGPCSPDQVRLVRPAG
jgi:hypothetical protein